MIDHWQGFELQLADMIAEIDYQHDRTPPAQTIPTRTSKP